MKPQLINPRAKEAGTRRRWPQAVDGCDLNVHLISPARSAPPGSERSHFAHSPHLLAALIPLIPPEIRGALKRKGRSRGRGLGFCAPGPPGRRCAGPPASPRVGNLLGDVQAGRAVCTFSVGAGSPGGGCQAEPHPHPPGSGSPGQAAGCAGRTGALGARFPRPWGSSTASIPTHFSPRDLPSVNPSLT